MATVTDQEQRRTRRPGHPWWCTDYDNDPHLTSPHRSDLDGVVIPGASFLAAVGLEQHPDSPVMVNVVVTTSVGPHPGEAEALVSLDDAVWMWQTLGATIRRLDPTWMIPDDLAADAYLATGTPPPAAARPPAVDIRPIDSPLGRITISVTGSDGQTVAPILNLARAKQFWRALTSYLKRLGEIPTT